MNRPAGKPIRLISPLIMATLVLITWTPSLFAINPQPEPPGEKAAAPTLRTSPAVDALGPQPEPPDKPTAKIKKVSPQSPPAEIPNPGTHSLGPQPEPPDRERRIK
jgi:hypothetical protein